MLKNLKQIGIVIFCLWHMAAVAVYALPWEATDPVTVWSNAHVLPIVKPYILWTSQWQQWNLFSPDPKGAYSLFRIEAADGPTWNIVESLAPADFTFLDRCDELKVLRRLEETDNNWQELRDRYLQNACARLNLAAGTPVRMMAKSTHLPRTRAPLLSWQEWEPDWYEWQVASAFCATGTVPDSRP